MIDVCGNDRAPTRHFAADEFRSDFARDIGAETFAGVLVVLTNSAL
jgi:hypothetical protein